MESLLNKAQGHIPNIYFLKFHYLFLAFLLLGSFDSYAKSLYLSQQLVSKDLIDLNLSMLIPNIMFLFVGLSIIKILNIIWRHDNIPAQVIVLAFAILGVIRAHFIDYLQQDLELNDVNERQFNFGNFKASVDIGDLTNGLISGISVALLLIWGAKFYGSEFKKRIEILRAQSDLRIEIESLEQGLRDFQNSAEKRIYFEILEKLNPLDIVRKINKKPTSVELEKYLREKVSKKIRTISSDLIKPKKPKYGTRRLIEIRDFTNSTELILKPKVFLFLSSIVILGDNASINSDLGILNTFYICVLCSFLLKLISRYLIIHLQKTLQNCSIALISAATLALFSEIFSVFLNYSVPVVIRFERFIIFLILILLISFVSNFTYFSKTQKIDQDSLTEIQIRSDFLKGSLKVMEREIAEHLHGYLIFRINSITSRIDSHEINDENFDILKNEILHSFSYESYSVLKHSLKLDSASLERLVSDWHGLIEINFRGNLDKLYLLPSSQNRECWNVIIEMINNAYRHGQATKIEIDFDFKQKGFLHLTAIDDGINPIPTYPRRGIGSTLIEIASEGNWSAANQTNGGVVVNVRIKFYQETGKNSSNHTRRARNESPH